MIDGLLTETVKKEIWLRLSYHNPERELKTEVCCQ